MTSLLLNWLNHDIQLSIPITNLPHDFSSGYLLGELLSRLNQQPNFSDFMNTATADAKIINFCLLEPTFRHLHIPFDASHAVAIMNMREDAAGNLLYQLQMTSKRLQRQGIVSTKSTRTIPLHTTPQYLAKPTYDAINHQLFEQAIRRQVYSQAHHTKEQYGIA